MNIKKIARPINKAKNEFLQWLRDRGAEDIEDDTCGSASDPFWDYYHVVTAFVGDDLYMVDFMIWKGRFEIKYSFGEHNQTFNNVDDFLKLIR